MLYLFDLDGTLISSYMDNPGKEYNVWSILPGVQAKIAALVMEGHHIGIITNQAGVAYGFIQEEEACTRFQKIAAALGYKQIAVYSGFGDPMYWSAGNEQPITRRALPIYVCYDKAGPRRKPNGAMIEQAMSDAAIDYYIPAENDDDIGEFADVPVLYVGDRPEDQQAAAAAGVPFQWADRFFGG